MVISRTEVDRMVTSSKVTTGFRLGSSIFDSNSNFIVVIPFLI